MFLVVKPIKIQMRSAFGDTDGRDGASLSFVIEMSGQDQLELKTGEIFESSQFTKIRGNSNKAISATLGVIPTNSAEDFRANVMRYFEAFEVDGASHPSSIHFTVFVYDREMQQIVSSIRAGMTPASIMIDLRHELFNEASPVSYGWAPDGSIMVWKNAEISNRSVAIKSIAFDFDILRQRDENPEDLDARPMIKSHSSDNITLTKKIDMLVEQMTKLSRSLALAAIVIAIVFYFSR